MTTTLLTRHGLWVDDRGDGPPVLLIAGLGDPAEAWTFQQEELSSRYRTIAFDNRGVGRSPLPDTPLTVAGMADDAATILDELGIDRADIVGFSGGSVTAQELAIRHPERVKSLVLMGTFGKGDRYFDAVVRMFTWMMDQAPDPHAFLEAFYLWIYTVAGARERVRGPADRGGAGVPAPAVAGVDAPAARRLGEPHHARPARAGHRADARDRRREGPRLPAAPRQGGRRRHPRRPVRGVAGSGPPTLPGRARPGSTHGSRPSGRVSSRPMLASNDIVGHCPRGRDTRRC